MTDSDFSFDSIFCKLSRALIPGLGPRIAKYYVDHGAFRRFVKFGFSVLWTYWLLRAPLIWTLTLVLPGSFIFIPGYLWATFIVGLILTVVGFLQTEGWIYKSRKDHHMKQKR